MNPKQLLAVIVLLIAPVAQSHCAEWRSLFDGSYSGWTHRLSFPHESVDLAGLRRDDATRKYLEPLGWDNDPLKVFTIATVEGKPAMRFSGQVFGYLQTDESFGDFHLRLQFKWGEKKWAPRADRVRDSGLLYFVTRELGRGNRTWPTSLELQIQEQDCGDLWTIDSEVTVRARPEPTAGGDATPQFIYDPAGAPKLFDNSKGGASRCVKLLDAENPHGEWNTIELIVLDDDSIHIVNGKVVMRLNAARQQTDAAMLPVTSGRIALQSEGAEIFFRNIEIKSITEIPAPYSEG